MNGKQSVIKQYLSNNFFFMKKDDTRTYTHLLLDGGKLYIPPEKRDEFLSYYAHRLDVNDDKLYVIENKTKNFKLFFDLDILSSHGLPDETMKHIIIIIQKSIYEKLKDNFSSHELRTIVCTTSNKTKNVGGTLWEKTGIHLRWPELVVNKKTALGIRNICLEALHKYGGSRPEVNPWEDVVDKCVFEENGIRMIGSRKIQNCQHCRSRKIDTKTCLPCKGTGKIDEGRFYTPSMIIDGKGADLQKQLAKLVADKQKMIKEVSIQTDYEELPKSIHIEEKYFVNEEKSRYQKKITDFGGEKKNIFNIGDDYESLNSQQITLDDNKKKRLMKFIHKTMPAVYADIKVTNIKRINNDDYAAYILYTNSRFCMNINTNHNSNGIYFLIDKNYIYQKCWCKCNTLRGRRFGYCMNYKSDGRPLDLSIQNMLFPDEKNNIKTTVYIPPLSSLKGNSKSVKNKYEKSLSETTDQLISKLTNRKEYEDEIVGKSLKMKLK